MVGTESREPARSPRVSTFTAAEAKRIAVECGWYGPVENAAERANCEAWFADAAAWLGPYCETPEALKQLLAQVFCYDALALLRQPESHVVITRQGARAVIRELAWLVLGSPTVDSDRFKQIVTALKEKLPVSGREMFSPLRLALAGRAGEGEMDRVILLLDRAAALPFAVKVKSCRERMLEFCSVME